MPLYDYRCTQCGKISEIRHGFDASHTEPCPACGGPLARVFNPAPILFKGSGFYVTDSRKSSAATSASPEPSPAKNDAPVASPPPASDSKASDPAA